MEEGDPLDPGVYAQPFLEGKNRQLWAGILEVTTVLIPISQFNMLGNQERDISKTRVGSLHSPMAPAPSPENINAKPRWMSSLVYELWGYPYLPNDNIIWYLHGTIPGSPSHPAKESPKLVVQWLNAERQLGSFISLKNNVFDTMTTKLLFSFGGWLGTSCWSNNINPK